MVVDRLVSVLAAVLVLITLSSRGSVIQRTATGATPVPHENAGLFRGLRRTAEWRSAAAMSRFEQ
jgi:hypothetical protein